MTDTRTLQGRILTPLGWRRGHVHFDSHVRQLQVDDHSGADDLQLPVILPGFIDLHVHGAAGVDLMQGGDVARTIARTHLRFGTTTLLATTMTAGLDEIEHALHGVDDGTSFWAHTEPGAAASAVAWLDSMRFMMRVEVADVSDEVAVVWSADPDATDPAALASAR